MGTESFRRARTPEQRGARRDHILAVTRGLLRGRRVADVSLNEIARQVGLAKSNVLRYFGSREAILLVLTEREYAQWVEELESGAGGTVAGETGASASASSDARVQALAADLARTVTRRPLLCELLGCTTTVLEHNVTVDEVLDFKLAIHGHMERLVRLIESRIGALDDAGMLLFALHAVIAEVWAFGHPAPTLAEAAARDARIMQPPGDLAPTMARALTLVLRGARKAQ
ncbi:MAG: TetR family transcriptional regulator [Actinomycetaceae bacterium]|nr:TetR family transcriptional regulator [Actinomycetaceae bacterium]